MVYKEAVSDGVSAEEHISSFRMQKRCWLGPLGLIPGNKRLAVLEDDEVVTKRAGAEEAG